MKKKNTKAYGFTLIEIMIVMVIMGLLTVLGFFTFQTSQKRGRDSKRKSDLSQIAKALEMYTSDSTNNAYPSASSGQIVGCGTKDVKTVCAWGQPFTITVGAYTTVYMALLPDDPVPGYTYYYEKTGYGYMLYAYLENPDDTSIVVTSKSCGPVNCNYIVRSSNITPAP